MQSTSLFSQVLLLRFKLSYREPDLDKQVAVKAVEEVVIGALGSGRLRDDTAGAATGDIGNFSNDASAATTKSANYFPISVLPLL